MRLKKNRNNKTEKVNLRCTESELNAIKRKANIYTEGNISEYLLYSALNFVPDKNDFEDEKTPVKNRGKK